MTSAGRIYGGVPAVERDADRRSRLLEAGLELFGTRGVADVTVADVCAEAGLTKRYFYQQFESIDRFIDAVMEHVIVALAERASSQPIDPDDAERPRVRIAAFVDAIASDRRYARLVLVETFGADGSLAGLRQRLVHRAVERTIADYLPPERVGVGDPQSVQMTAYALSGACAELLLAWIQGEIDVDADQVVDYLADLFAAAAGLIRAASH